MDQAQAVVSWGIAIGFLLTMIVTLMGLVGILKISETYLKRLFVVLVVELIGAGFYMFYQQFDGPPPEFAPEPSTKVYLFDLQGEPFESTLLQGEDTLMSFPGIARDALRDVTRSVEVEGADLVIRSSSGVRLGRVRNARDSISTALLTSEQLLGLGHYYAECRESGQVPCESRRSGSQAVSYLLGAVSAGVDTPVQEAAAVELFYLLDYMNRCDEFGRLADAISSSRRPPKRYHELAETYLAFSRSAVADAHPGQRREARKGALKYYLSYLAFFGERAVADTIGATVNARQRVRELWPAFSGDIPTVPEAGAPYLSSTGWSIGDDPAGMPGELMLQYSHRIEASLGCRS